MKACIHPEGDIHTPYGATEALPVASISASEVLGDMQHGRADPARRGRVRRPAVPRHPVEGHPHRRRPDPVARRGRGIAGRRDRRTDRPRPAGHAAIRHPRGIERPGEDCRRRPGFGIGWAIPAIWTTQGRFWFCGRVAHRVRTADGPMYPVRCEAIFNQHPDIRRSALVGVGPAGRQRPVIVLEPHEGRMPAATGSPRGVARRRSASLARPTR